MKPLIMFFLLLLITIGCNKTEYNPPNDLLVEDVKVSGLLELKYKDSIYFQTVGDRLYISLSAFQVYPELTVDTIIAKESDKKISISIRSTIDDSILELCQRQIDFSISGMEYGTYKMEITNNYHTYVDINIDFNIGCSATYVYGQGIIP